MPKDRTKRASVHPPSARLSKRQFAIHGLKQVEVGSLEDVSGVEVLQPMEKHEPPNATKKEKQQLKRAAFMEKLQSSHPASSKNQKRRLKKKLQEKIGGGLDAIQDAISALDNSDTPHGSSDQPLQGADESTHPKAKPKQGQIGEGKGAPLKQNQRKQALEMERLRAPMILANPDYASNPFHTIRTHAQNTLLKHEHPAS